MILVGGDKGTAKDAAFVRSGKCEQRTGVWLDRVIKIAATGFMLAGSKGRAEPVITIAGFEFSFVHALEILAKTSRYLVVVLNPTVKWLWISGSAKASFSGSAISEEAARCSLILPFIFLCLFFARFPLEGVKFRDLFSPIGPSRLQKRCNQLWTLSTSTFTAGSKAYDILSLPWIC